MQNLLSPHIPWFQNLQDVLVGSPAPVGPATSYSMSLAFSSGSINSPVTITFVANGTTNAVVTPAMAGLAGSFSATNVTLNGTSPVTITFTPSAGGTGTLTATNNGSLTNPGSSTYIATAPTPVVVISLGTAFVA